ncbi:MAG: TetR/AcrR family transcriptional regulator [Anaerolineaceae bacterium]|nr:TetR/AcrR family transcriptional regulator [Anaerolineaceae bacterium]
MVRIVKKPAERRLEIIRAARRLFQTKEYNNTTMQDVMDDLGIAKGTIYYYFKSKEDLLEAVIENIVDESIEQMQSALVELNGNALDKLRILIGKGNMAAANGEILESLHQPGNSSMHNRLLAAALIKQAPVYAGLIQQGCQEGLFQTDTPLECAEFILAALQFLTDQGIYPWTQSDLIRRALAFPGLIEAQLKAAPGSFRFMLVQN